MSANHEAALHLNETQTNPRNEMPSLIVYVHDAGDPTCYDNAAENFDFGDPCNEEPVQGRPPVQDHADEHLTLQSSIISRGILCTPSKRMIESASTQAWGRGGNTY